MGMISIGGDRAAPGRPARRRTGVLSAILTFCLLTSLAAPPAEADQVTLFAAASTTEAVEAVASRYREAGGGPIRGVFAASSTLAKQIAQGAPADLFLSASADWMDYLEGKGVLEPGSRRPLLANRLVLIVPEGSPAGPGDGTLPPLNEILTERPLAIADPAHVPAGIYAEAALRALGQWEAVAGRTVRTGDVRAALALVDRGEAAAGIVYATDAPIARRARVLAVFPADSHPPIVYPLAVVAGRGRPAVARFVDFLLGPEAAAIFAAHGFHRPAGPDG